MAQPSHKMGLRATPFGELTAKNFQVTTSASSLSFPHPYAFRHPWFSVTNLLTSRRFQKSPPRCLGRDSVFFDIHQCPRGTFRLWGGKKRNRPRPFPHFPSTCSESFSPLPCSLEVLFFFDDGCERCLLFFFLFPPWPCFAPPSSEKGPA